MKLAATYARVASVRLDGKRTIESQTAALVELARRSEFEIPIEWIFEDEGYGGRTLARPALERLRHLAEEGQIQAVLVYRPDRLSRAFADLTMLIEEFKRSGVETRFAVPSFDTTEDQPR